MTADLPIKFTEAILDEMRTAEVATSKSIVRQQCIIISDTRTTI